MSSTCQCFDLAQSNSEHSRHWFFRGRVVVDGRAKDDTLFNMVKDTLRRSAHSGNSIIAFHDNSSVCLWRLLFCVRAVLWYWPVPSYSDGAGHTWLRSGLPSRVGPVNCLRPAAHPSDSAPHTHSRDTQLP